MAGEACFHRGAEGVTKGFGGVDSAAEGGEEFVEFEAEFFGVGVCVGGAEGGDGSALPAAG